MEDDLIETRAELKRLSDEHQKQREEIAALEKRLQPTSVYEQLKQRQNLLEEQLAEQCEKTIRLENLLQEENIGAFVFLSFVTSECLCFSWN